MFGPAAKNMAEEVGVKTVTDALTVNASVGSLSVAVTNSLPSLSSSSSCVSSSSPTSASLGSTGGGSVALEIAGANPQLQQGFNSQGTKPAEICNDDDSSTNVNTASTNASISNNQCNSSGERTSSDSDHRGSTEDIITHLNMLSMQDGLGFNGFGLLGSGTGNNTNAWTSPTVTNNIPLTGNGLNKQTNHFGHAQDQQQLNVAGYIEALKMQQQLQLQQMKQGGLSNDVISNLFAASSPSTNSATNIFGTAAPTLHQHNQHFRRPIFGVGGGGGNENVCAGPYGNFLVNRPAGGAHFPPPVEFANHERGHFQCKPFSSNSTAAVSDNVCRHLAEHFTTAWGQQPLPPAATSSYFNSRRQTSGNVPFHSAPASGLSRSSYCISSAGGGGRHFDHCGPIGRCHHQHVYQPNLTPLAPPFIPQDSLRRGFAPSLSSHHQAMNVGSTGAGGLSSPASEGPFARAGGTSVQRYSRKVFVGGLPPDIDEAFFKRPSSVMKYSDTSAAIPPAIPSTNPSDVNLLMRPSKLTIASLVSSPNAAAGNASAGQESFSRKVFVGGLPMDINEDEICNTFMRFGSLVVDWPHKAESKSYFPPKGYAFLIFHHENSVQLLIENCVQQEGRYYMCVSSPTMREKAVQIRPWRLSDADFVLDPSLPLDPRKTVFVGGVPRPLKAVELAAILERLFGGVCYTGIDTDPELKYPKGAGRVSFSNQQCYITAISARFVQLQHGDIDKRVEIKPYVLDDQMCDECGGARCAGKFAPYFCANVGCLQYYCDLCWQQIHSKAGREFHKPLVKEGSDRPRAVPFKWNM